VTAVPLADGRADDHQLAARLATEAGHLLLALRAELVAAGVPRWRVMDEGDGRAHHFLAGALAEARPGDAILSEEGRDSPNRLANNRVWIVDPLDGTNEFGEDGRDEWAVHVALVVDGTPSAAAVALPVLGLTLSTDPPAALPPPRRGPPCVVTSRWHAPYAAAVIGQALGAQYLRLGGAGAKAMAVVRGVADVYAHAGGMYEWDSAAPSAVAAAAGCHVSRLDGSPLVYNQRDPWLPDLLICRPELAEPVLDALWS
jgi:3'(2'), 5'-bisphosphate nucleotidase